MKKLFKSMMFLMLSLGTAFNAFGAGVSPDEICGNGIDDTGAYIGSACPSGWVLAKVNPLNGSQAIPGCDLLCPSPDQDNDTFPDAAHCTYNAADPSTYCDPDDIDKSIYPGSGPTTKGCSGGQVRYPNNNGTFTSCAAWACPAGRTCKYIDPVNGNDTTGTGAIGAPWKSLGKISYWYFTATPPFSLYTPVTGDLFILRDGTFSDLYNFQYTATDANIFECRNNSAVIGFWAYPGEKPIVDNTVAFGSATWLEGCGRQEWLGVQFKTKGSGLTFQGTSFDAKNIIATAPGANGDNLGCILSHSTTDSNVYNSILYDCYKSASADSPNPANNSNYVDFRSVNLKLYAPTIFYTSLVTSGNNGDKIGLGLKVSKHANYGSSVTVEKAVIFNTHFEAIGSGAPNVLVQHSRIAHGYSIVRSADFGGPTYLTGQLNSGIAFDFNRNTVWDMNGGLTRSPTKQYNINGTSAADPCSGDVTIGTFRVRNNYINSTMATFNQDNRFFVQNPYGPDALLLLSTLSFTNNTYYDQNGTISLGINESNNGDTTCAGRGNLGQLYTYVQWQTAGFDTAGSGSEITNCLMDQFQRCTAAGTTTVGWALLSEEGAPVPTPTPTATPGPFGTTQRGNGLRRLK